MDKKTYQAYIEEKKELVFEVSDKIWEYAELSLKEHKSCQLYCKVLKEEGFTVENPVAGIETAFAASFGSGSPVIGILGEYDALSGLSQKAGAAERCEILEGGNGHGCGHNMLGAGSRGKLLELQPRLLLDAFQKLTRPVVRQFPVDRHLSLFRGMPELAVAAFLVCQIPTVFFQDSDDFRDFHYFHRSLSFGLAIQR